METATLDLEADLMPLTKVLRYAPFWYGGKRTSAPGRVQGHGRADDFIRLSSHNRGTVTLAPPIGCRAFQHPLVGPVRPCVRNPLASTDAARPVHLIRGRLTAG